MIAIKGMSMLPENCNTCPIGQVVEGQFECGVLGWAGVTWICDEEVRRGGRHKCCPLIEIKEREEK